MKKILLPIIFLISSFCYSQTFTQETLDFDSGTWKYIGHNYKGAIQDFNKVIKINPKNGSAYYCRGMAKAELKDYRGAMQDYNKAIEINPEDSDAYCYRGIIKKELGDYRGAIQDLNKAFNTNPRKYSKDTDAYLNRGMAKMFLNDKNGGCLDLSKAGELGRMEAYDLIKKYCN